MQETVVVSLSDRVKRDFERIATEMGMTLDELAEAVICDYIFRDMKLKRWFEKSVRKDVV